MAISKDEFRCALGSFVSGVTVVTTWDDNRLYGLTVSAFSSLSIDPPLVLICVDKKTASHDAFTKSGAFAINILADDQENISRQFASRTPDKFQDIAYFMGANKAPILEGTVASMECLTVQAYEGGDHTIFIGEVQSSVVRDAQPLSYFRGGYRRLSA
jgi:flavin reductase (DIM6/NTAB) family NADH-FMN oxidoreductase RutF